MMMMRRVLRPQMLRSTLLRQPLYIASRRNFHVNGLVLAKKPFMSSFSQESYTYTTSDGKRVTTTKTTVNGETKTKRVVESGNGTRIEEIESGRSVASRLLSGIGSVVLFPVKLVFGVVGIAAMELLLKRVAKSIGAAMGKAFFGRMVVAKTAEETLMKRLQSMRVAGQISNEKSHEDFIMLHALRVLQTHPIVHETISKTLYAASPSDPNVGVLKKVSGYITSMFKTRDSSEERKEHYTLMTDLQVVNHERSLVGPSKISCESDFLILVVEDDEDGTMVAQIEKFKEAVEEIRREKPYLNDEEMIVEAQRVKLDRDLGAMFPFKVRVSSHRINSVDAPYKIDKIDLLDTDKGEVMLSLDQLSQEGVDDESTTNERPSDNYRAKQIIDADFVEK